jgi:hypothetical protein
MSKKVLISGRVLDAAGWAVLQTRVQELQASKHGPFDFLLVLGSQVPQPDLGASVPVLVLDGSDSRIVDFGGIKIGLVPDSALTAVEGAVDILLSGRPPKGFHRALGGPLPAFIKPDVDALSSSSAALSARLSKPRYHFASGLGSYYQRPPYNNGQGVTRLVFVAPVGDAKPPAELKWLHALNLPAASAAPSLAEAALPGVTGNPFEAPAGGDEAGSKRMRALTDSAAAPGQFFFAPALPPAAGPPRRPKVPPRMDCWFCLASPSCEKHLIASVGEDLYIALPKGGIQPEHALVITVTHEANFASLPPPSLDEVARHMDSLVRAFAQRGFACMFAERSLVLGKAAQRHCYLEALPVPAALLGQCEEALLKEAQLGGFPFEAVGEGAGASHRQNLNALCQAVGAEAEYVYFQLPGGKAFLHRVRAGSGSAGHSNNRGSGSVLPMQLGRAVACRLLGKPDLVAWQNCIQPPAVEKAWTDMIKKGLL